MNERIRSCYVCGTPISECMGYVIAGDFLDFMEGKRKDVRELCGKDVLRYEFSDLVKLLGKNS